MVTTSFACLICFFFMVNASSTALWPSNILSVTEPEPSCLVKTRAYQLFAQRYMDKIPRATLVEEIDRGLAAPSPHKTLILGILDEVYSDKPTNFVNYGKEKFAACEKSKGKSYPDHLLNSCFTNLYIMDTTYRMKAAGQSQNQVNEFLSKRFSTAYVLYEHFARKVQSHAYRGNTTESELVERNFHACLVRSNTRDFQGTIRRVSSGDTVVLAPSGMNEMELRLHGVRAPKQGDIGFEDAKKELEQIVLGHDVQATAYTDTDGVVRGTIYLKGRDVAIDLIQENFVTYEPSDFEGITDIRSELYAISSLYRVEKRWQAGSWSVTRRMDGQKTHLIVTKPGNQSGHTVVSTPFRISAYAIDKNGEYLAYVSNEGGYEALYIQSISSGRRLKWISLGDGSGKLEFLNRSLIYRSPKDDLIFSLIDISLKIQP